MTPEALQNLQYPIGTFHCPDLIDQSHITNWISILEQFPERLAQLVNPLSETQLNTPYRPQGWSIRQTVHHLSDSHQHSYIRLKWTLTEDKPLIKAYYEDRWAELMDSKTAPIAMSLQHLKAIHFKWVYILKNLGDEDLNKCFIHPETKKEVSLKQQTGLYAWHSNHHYAHIENLLRRQLWL